MDRNGTSDSSFWQHHPQLWRIYMFSNPPSMAYVGQQDEYLMKSAEIHIPWAKASSMYPCFRISAHVKSKMHVLLYYRCWIQPIRSLSLQFFRQVARSACKLFNSPTTKLQKNVMLEMLEVKPPNLEKDCFQTSEFSSTHWSRILVHV